MFHCAAPSGLTPVTPLFASIYLDIPSRPIPSRSVPFRPFIVHLSRLFISILSLALLAHPLSTHVLDARLRRRWRWCRQHAEGFGGVSSDAEDVQGQMRWSEFSLCLGGRCSEKGLNRQLEFSQRP